jgi:hypothetical protein
VRRHADFQRVPEHISTFIKKENEVGEENALLAVTGETTGNK